MIIYIAGKMTGLQDLGKDNFNNAEKKLKEKGHIVLNPAMLPEGLDSRSYIPIGLAMIDAADAVYMLKSHRDSVGADLEMRYAMYQGKLILFEGLSDQNI